MSDNRNRAEGWKWAKMSGHKNEEEIKNHLNQNENLFSSFCYRLLGEKGLKGRAIAGGLNESNVPSVLKGSTKSKTDMRLNLQNGHTINISIKKSKGGQVFLVSVSRFIKGFEMHFQRIPSNIKKAIKLYWGNHENIEQFISEYGEKEKKHIKDLEVRKNRLVGTSLKRYDLKLAESLLDWLKNNISKITLYCFSRGLAKNREDWADFIWYKNFIKKDPGIDKIFDIKIMSNAMKNHTEHIHFGPRYGGSTIWLPFGFVQWHQKQMQFHHKYNDIEGIYDF